MKTENTYLFRAFAVWLLIILAETIHGTLRQVFLAPLVGDFPARQISVFPAMAVIFLVAFFFIRRINAPSKRSLFAVGLMWVGLTVIFEFVLGIFVLNQTREPMSEDYDLSRGGLMIFGLLFLFIAPFLANKVRGSGSKGTDEILFIDLFSEKR